MNTSDMRARILEQWALINTMAGRRFPPTLAEEAALYVLEKLQEDDCRRIRKHDGRSSLAAFIGIITSRLLEDFARKKFGRLRPPAWLRKLGGIWMQLYDLLCRQRLSTSDAVELLLARSVAGRARVDGAARIIKARITDCGRHQALEVALDDEGQYDASRQAQVHDPEEEMAAAERRLFYSLLLGREIDEGGSAVVNRLVTALRAMPRLTAEERLLLQMIYRDEVSVREAGIVLGLNVNQVHGRLRRLLTRLRNGLKKAGLEEELRQLL